MLTARSDPSTQVAEPASAIPTVDRKQWCVKASGSEIEVYERLAAKHGISVPELFRRAAFLLEIQGWTA